MTNFVINQQTLDQLKQHFASGNRTQVYIDLFGITGSNQALIEAQISTFSESYGAIANTANDLAAYFNSEQYPSTVENLEVESVCNALNGESNRG